MTNEQWKNLSVGDIVYTTISSGKFNGSKVFLRLKKYEPKWKTWISTIISDYSDPETSTYTGSPWTIGKKDKYFILTSKKIIRTRLNLIAGE